MSKRNQQIERDFDSFLESIAHQEVGIRPRSFADPRVRVFHLVN